MSEKKEPTQKTPMRTYTPDQKAEVIAALASGMTQRQAAKVFNMPAGTVAVWRAGAKSIMLVQDYREVVLASAKQYAAIAWRALNVQAELLSDRQYLTEHGGEVFGLASAHRVVAETLGRILAAVGE